MSNIPLSRMTLASQALFECTNMQEVYQGAQVRKVRCGKCASCRLAKNVQIVHDIQNYAKKFKKCYFTTLTYASEYLPKLYCMKGDKFVNKDGSVDTEIEFIPLPRDLTKIRNRFPKLVGSLRSVDYEDSCTCYLNADQLEHFRRAQAAPKNQIYYAPYKDIQLFFKRLRDDIANLFKVAQTYSERRQKRDPKFPKFSYTPEDTKISYFVVSEYGSKKKRPHWHILLFFNSPFIERFIARRVYKNWLYGITDTQLSRGQCASYVASYLQCHNDFDSIFSVGSPLRPVRHASCGFTRVLLPSRTTLKSIKEIKTICTTGVDVNINGSIVRRLPSWSDIGRFFPKLRDDVLQRPNDAWAVFRSVFEITKRTDGLINPLFEDSYNLTEIIQDIFDTLKSKVSEYISLCDPYHRHYPLDELYSVGVLTKHECIFIDYLDIYHYLKPRILEDIEVHTALGRIYRLYSAIRKACISWSITSYPVFEEFISETLTFWREHKYDALRATYRKIQKADNIEFTEFMYDLKFDNYESETRKSKKSLGYNPTDSLFYQVDYLAQSKLRTEKHKKDLRHGLSEDTGFF